MVGVGVHSLQRETRSYLLHGIYVIRLQYLFLMGEKTIYQHQVNGDGGSWQQQHLRITDRWGSGFGEKLSSSSRG